MQFKELPQKIQMLLNNLDQAGNSLKTDVDWVLPKIKSPEDIARLLPRLEAVIATLQSIAGDLEDPLRLIEEIAEHPCDPCEVTKLQLDPNEHCDGCINEMRLMDYVPPHLRE